MRFKFVVFGPIVMVLALFVVLLFGSDRHAPQLLLQAITPPTLPPAGGSDEPGPFANVGQLVLAVLMVLQGVFNAWWTSYQRGKSEKLQIELQIESNKLQAAKETREFEAREREKEREWQRLGEERETAYRIAQNLAEVNRKAILEQTTILNAKIDENTNTTTATLNAANHLTEKVVRAGALRKSDITAADVADPATLRRRADDGGRD